MISIRSTFPDVARAADRSKHAGTKHGEKIEAKSTIFVPSMFNAKRVNAAVLRAINTQFPVFFERDVRFFTAKFGGG